MVLAIDIGNTNIVIGVYENKKLIFSFRMATNLLKTEYEYSVNIKDIMEVYKINICDIKGCIISSVVPPISHVIKKSITHIFSIDAIMVEPGIKTGMNILLDNPSQLGSDLLCTAVGAFNKYKSPIIVVDLGTATKITAVDEYKNFIGGAIMPGVKISLDALSNKTAQLPHISLDVKDIRPIGKNTVECMQSGMVIGTACTIDGMIRRFKRELNDNTVVLGCGGLIPYILPYCEEKIIHNKHLILEGLITLYYKNI